MAEQKPRFKEDDFVSKVVKNPKEPADALLLQGFLGASSEEGYTRLYFDPQLSDYVEIPNDAILHVQEIPKEQSPLGGNLVWIRRDAEVIHGKVGPDRLKAKFLEGRIQQEYMKDVQFAGGGAGAGGLFTFPHFGCPPLTLPLQCHFPTRFEPFCPTRFEPFCPTRFAPRCPTFGPTIIFCCDPVSFAHPCPQSLVHPCPPSVIHPCPPSVFHPCPTHPLICVATVPGAGCPPVTAHCTALPQCPVASAIACPPPGPGPVVGGFAAAAAFPRPTHPAHVVCPPDTGFPQCRTQFDPECPFPTEVCPSHHVGCTRFDIGCHPPSVPWIACPTHQPPCTHFGPGCPPPPSIPAVACPTHQPGCTQFGPQCPPPPSVPIFTCPTHHLGCTQFGPGCPPQTPFCPTPACPTHVPHFCPTLPGAGCPHPSLPAFCPLPTREG